MMTKNYSQQEDIQELYFLLLNIEQRITPNSNMIWTSYANPDQLKTKLQFHRTQLINDDPSCLDELETLFSPTGDLQEHSLSNGWEMKFLQESSHFDKLIHRIKRRKNTSELRKRINSTWESAIELLFPSICITCSTRLHGEEQHICLNCLNKLPKTNYHLQEENRLEDFLAGKFPFERAMAFCYFYKTGSIQKIIHEFKYNQNPSLARFMGQLYGNDLKQAPFLRDIDYLIPVPLHQKKQKKRGYNQAEEICKGLSYSTGIPICNNAIVRLINNPSQTKHSKNERWENVNGIFGISDSFPLEGKTILLVDDVITTGSTLEAIIKSFPENETPKIYIASIGMAM